MKSNCCKTQQKGTTLIEVLLYSLLVSSFLFVVSYFATDAIGNKSRNDARAEINDNAQIVTEQITSAIRNAQSIQSPVSPDQSDSTLIINVSNNKITYSAVDGRLQVSENDGVQVALTSSNIIVSNLTFTNLSSPLTEGNIRIQMDLAFRNPSGSNELNASVGIDATATLRPN